MTLWGLALTLGLAAASPRPLAPPAPELPDTALWINAKPFTLKAQKNRKIVLLAFINTGNLNSVRSFGTLKLWHERYAKEGLIVIGVHTPAYAFQLTPERVQRLVKHYKLTFPVVLDNDRKIWEAYKNDGWPAFYLISHQGKIIFDRLGEGGYSELEQEILDALDNVPGGRAPENIELAPDIAKTDCGPMTPDTSAGTKDGRPLELKPNEKRLSFIFSVREGELGFQGPWTAGSDSVRLLQDNPDWDFFTSVIYRGAQAYSLMGPLKGRNRYYVRQDDLWMHPGNAGRDIQFDDDGRSFVDTPFIRLYELARNANTETHELSLMPSEKGALVYGFSFSDSCLMKFAP
jgi:hypothetical protein